MIIQPTTLYYCIILLALTPSSCITTDRVRNVATHTTDRRMRFHGDGNEGPADDVIALIRLSTESFSYNDAPNLLKLDDLQSRFTRAQSQLQEDTQAFSTEKLQKSSRMEETALRRPSETLKSSDQRLYKDVFPYSAQEQISESVRRSVQGSNGRQRTSNNEKLPLKATLRPETTHSSRTRLKLYECLLNCSRFTSQCHSMVNKGNIQEGFVCLQASTLCRNECRLRRGKVSLRLKTII